MYEKRVARILVPWLGAQEEDSIKLIEFNRPSQKIHFAAAPDTASLHKLIPRTQHLLPKTELVTCLDPRMNVLHIVSV